MNVRLDYIAFRIPVYIPGGAVTKLDMSVAADARVAPEIGFINGLGDQMVAIRTPEGTYLVGIHNIALAKVRQPAVAAKGGKK